MLALPQKFRPAALARSITMLSVAAPMLVASPAIAGQPVKDAGKTPVQPPSKKALTFFDDVLTFDVEERLRFEARSNNRDFDDAFNDDNDDAWLLHRFRLGIGVRATPWLRLYAQGQDAREWESDRLDIPGVRGAEGDDAFDLRQAYVEVGNLKSFPLALTVGRQVLAYGDRRLVGDSQWGNFGRTFDAARLRYERPDFWAEAFFGRPVQIRRDAFNDSDAADNFAGIYLSSEALGFQTTDLYAFHRDKRDNQPDLDPVNKFDAEGASSGPAGRYTTLGTRLKSKPGALRGWDYTGEFAYQFGDIYETDRRSKRFDLRAFALHVSGGYTFESLGWKPRIGLEYNFASGDRDPADARSQSFQNLFPSNHEKYGFMDEFGWRNLHNARVQLNVKPLRTVELELDYHAFWLADTSDYWFRSNGTSTLRTRTPGGEDVRGIGADNFAGHEVDFTVTWNATKNLKVQAGYSHFFAGGYLRDTGPHDDADFGFVMAALQF